MFKDFALEHTGGKLPGDSLFTHCHRELFHAQWAELLDSEFVNAYKHGLVLTCADGIKRRLYPRIFTYSTDYPEKYVLILTQLPSIDVSSRVLIANIRNLGACPCTKMHHSKGLHASYWDGK